MVYKKFYPFWTYLWKPAIDGFTFDVLCGTYGTHTAAHEDSRMFVSEIEVESGPMVDFYAEDTSSELSGDFSSYPYGVQTGRSFVQGRDLKASFYRWFSFLGNGKIQILVENHNFVQKYKFW